MKRIEQVRNCYNQTAEEYADAFTKELEGKPLDRMLLKRFAEDNAKKGRMGDLGCGPGHTTAFLYQNGARDIIGIDLSSEMVRVAQQQNDPVIQFSEGNMLQLDYPDQSFGSMVAMYAIVHFVNEEIQQVAQEMFRLIAPKGQVLLSFHVGEEIRTVVEFLGKTLTVEFQFFDPDHVITTFQNAGFHLAEGLVRYPYEGQEYPSRRAYLLFEKK